MIQQVCQFLRIGFGGASTIFLILCRKKKKKSASIDVFIPTKSALNSAESRLG